MARPIAQFTLDPQQEGVLRDAAREPSTPQRVAQRCRVLLQRGAGLSQAEAGRREGLTRTHDCIRHGTVTLFAALSYLSGKVFGLTAPRHTHKEWLAFLKRLDRETPPELDLHLIIDNYATHKHPKVRAWLEKRPRFHLHFTPTSGSWLNRGERFFGELTARVVREGSFASVKELAGAIKGCLAQRNLSPKPCRWRAKGPDILAKIQRAKAAQALHHGIS